MSNHPVQRDLGGRSGRPVGDGRPWNRHDSNRDNLGEGRSAVSSQDLGETTAMMELSKAESVPIGKNVSTIVHKPLLLHQLR